ncbi:MAG TPA: hypothetical protein VHB79_29260 [Polyangiaceae bacterium]|nr:hypothetical protein [Polyangiaceae bacterium]
MRRSNWFGWALVGAFSAVVSCGGGSGDPYPKGFGLSCKDDTTCENYDLLCGNGKCVQCLGDSDCDGDKVCTSGLCKASVDCSDSSDCSGGQVCDQASGTCVGCLSSKDCDAGQACMDHGCQTRPACDYTSDCSGGLLCEVSEHICVACRDDEDCGYKRVCEDYECVSEPSGTGGKSGGTGGKSSGGTSSGGTSSGGKNGGGNGGTTAGIGGSVAGGGMGGAGAGGTGGALGEGGVGGVIDCGCTLDEVCTPDERCVAPTLIDDFEDCDAQILDIEGRHGDWASDADTGITFASDISDPGAIWIDRTCAAWATGKEKTLNNPNATFAFVGFRLNVDDLDAAHVYDLSSYTGIQIKLESPSSVQVVVKTSGGGYFQTTLGAIAGSNVRKAPFGIMSKMDISLEDLPIKLTTVTEIQFSVTTPADFRLAIHRVELY